MIGYLVSSRNGQGKSYFYETLEEAKRDIEKKHKTWLLTKVIKKDEYSYQILETIID